MYSGFLEESRDIGSKLNTELNENIKLPSMKPDMKEILRHIKTKPLYSYIRGQGDIKFTPTKVC